VIFLLLGALSGILQAQDRTGSITGSVVDKTSGAVLEGVDITLNKVKDSSLVKGLQSDAQGKFTFNDVPFGRYYIKANIVGYNASIVSGVTVNPGSISVTIDQAFNR
jgi:uncharacterized surface anchored protein